MHNINRQAIVDLSGGLAPVCLSFHGDDDYTVRDLKYRLDEKLPSPLDHDRMFLTAGSRVLNDDDVLFPMDCSLLMVNLNVRIHGGKGGFGSMLRAQGGRMNAQKTTNFEACRDLQGRRIRAVNEAKKLQEQLEALPKIEEEKRRKLQEKIEKALKEPEKRKYLFDDNEFLENREVVIEGVKNAVGNVFKRQKTEKKAAAATASSSVFDDDVEDSEDEDDEENEEEVEEEEQEEKGDKGEKEKDKGKASSTDVKGKGKGKENRPAKA